MSCRRVAIVQARTGSTRLPGKVLMDLGGHPMLFQQLRRLQHCDELDDLVVATTTNPDDDEVVNVARKVGTRWFRGVEDDVLGRMTEAAREAHADVVVRLTADCPLIDPAVVARVIMTLLDGRQDLDYASNTLQRTYPRGLDAEALFRDTLERVARRARSVSDREHVTSFIVREPTLFSLGLVKAPQDDSDLRWTVDTDADLTLARQLYADLDLGNKPALPYSRVVEHVRSKPELVRINRAVQQRQF